MPKTRKKAGGRSRGGSSARLVEVGGKKLVVMEQKEYDRLVDCADAAEARRIKADKSDAVLPWGEVSGGLIVNRIAERRREKGLTQRKLAERLGVRPSTLSRWERKDANLTLDTIRKIAKALRVKSAALIG
ncbi:MAG: helix-turn-helix domain-containing protein [Planctomycetota bacterium]|jgi:DNA-binding XRE family transcriptional regulator